MEGGFRECAEIDAYHIRHVRQPFTVNWQGEFAVLIECPRCEAKVHGKVLAEREYPPDEHSEPHKYVFLECPGCSDVLLGSCQWDDIFSETWFPPKRLWPDPQETWDKNVPQLVRTSLDEALKCFRARAYSACAVMSGRALEAICVELSGERTLAQGLKKLREAKVIDDRLFEWGEALRAERNLGAHATASAPGRQDARDVLDFANAIVDYVYVMSARFDAYKKRKQKSKPKPAN